MTTVGVKGLITRKLLISAGHPHFNKKPSCRKEIARPRVQSTVVTSLCWL